jgi:hypothetical protein
MPNKKINFKKDVSPPKDRIPSATSKNIIVSSKPIVQDQDILPDTKEALRDFSQSHKLVIQPLSDNASLKPDEILTSEALNLDQNLKKDDLPSPQMAESSLASTSQNDTASIKNLSESPASLDLSNQINQLRNQTSNDQSTPSSVNEKIENEASIEENKTEKTNQDKKNNDQIYQKTLEDLIDSKTYFLPIKVNQQNRKILIITFIVLVVVVFLWLELALYYKIITLSGFKSVF